MPHREQSRPPTAHASPRTITSTHVHPRPMPHREHSRPPTCTCGPSPTTNANHMPTANTRVHLRAPAAQAPPPTPTICLRITTSTANATNMPTHHDHQHAQLNTPIGPCLRAKLLHMPFTTSGNAHDCACNPYANVSYPALLWYAAKPTSYPIKHTNWPTPTGNAAIMPHTTSGNAHNCAYNPYTNVSYPPPL